MSEATFLFLVQRITPYIKRQDTVMRKAIPVEERLGVTLRFLATGRSLTDLQYSSSISRSLLSSLIPETCQAIIDCLCDYMQFPKNQADWLAIAYSFEKRWQFPNCGGAIDGKHVRIQQPHNSSSFFYNYKGFFSVILFAVVNANYEFIYVDVGINGRVSDGGALDYTEFGRRLNNDSLFLPSNDQTIGHLNFNFIADEAFPLQKNLLRPYPHVILNVERRIFNYRLSRARRVVENAFGILSSRFLIFHTAINLKLDSIDRVILAYCVLHNLLRKLDVHQYTPAGFDDTINNQTGLENKEQDDPDESDAATNHGSNENETPHTTPSPNISGSETSVIFYDIHSNDSNDD
ncbi:uncharacterized protein ACNLHF_028188 [Anomaloglossus baeobatrachus]